MLHPDRRFHNAGIRVHALWTTKTPAPTGGARARVTALRTSGGRSSNAFIVGNDEKKMTQLFQFQG